MIIFLLILLALFIIYSPYLDIYKDYRDKYHIILWYNSYKKDKKREYINIIGDPE